MYSSLGHAYSPLPEDEDSLLLPDRALSCLPSHLLFLWVRRILSGQRLRLPDSLRSEQLLSSLLACEASVQGLPLWRALHALVRTDFWLAGAYLLLNNVLVLFSSMLIKFIVRAVGERDQTKILLLSFAILITSLAQAVSLQQFIHGKSSLLIFLPAY